jgi:cytochrome P450
MSTSTPMSVSAEPTPRAGLVEVLAFNALVILPNLVEGLFQRRPAAVRAATALDLDGRAVQAMSRMSRRYDGRPIWVRAGLAEALLLLSPGDAARMLNGSVDDYASDTDTKRKGMAHFQPAALTISRGEQWRHRRRFTDDVLHAVSGLTSGIEECARQEAHRLIAASPSLTWKSWNRMFQRIARRVILGDAAARDRALTDTLERMMAGANRLPGKPSKHLPAFQAAIEEYLSRAEPGSLAAAVADVPSRPDTERAAQVTHWLFALGDTLASNALRALAVVGQRPAHLSRALDDQSDEYLAACLEETMRLWPTTPILSRETRTDVAWSDGVTIPRGTQVLIVNTFFHRDPACVPNADTFVPERWLDSNGASDTPFNHFSRGPQRCPGVPLALLVARTILRVALAHMLNVTSPHLPPEEPLPHMLDHFGIRAVVT